MEGKFFIKSKLDELNKHEHVIFGLDTGEELRYHDTRKFGKMHLVDINGYEKSFPLSQLGFEPFDELCDASYLYKKIKNKSIPIKQALLDQSILVGLGNIYVNEVLFRTRLHPEKRCNTITKKKCAEIIDASIETLNKAISLGGTTIRSYYTTDGVHGRFQNELLVHGRENELCFNCMSEIEKIKVGGRGTYYCPNCQKK
jgi:formamidopyrimidine-DNA glycosylase